MQAAVGVDLPDVKLEKLKALAVAPPQRMAQLPNTPTFNELELKDLQASTCWGITAPEHSRGSDHAFQPSAVAVSEQPRDSAQTGGPCRPASGW